LKKTNGWVELWVLFVILICLVFWLRVSTIHKQDLERQIKGVGGVISGKERVEFKRLWKKHGYPAVVVNVGGKKYYNCQDEEDVKTCIKFK